MRRQADVIRDAAPDARLSVAVRRRRIRGPAGRSTRCLPRSPNVCAPSAVRRRHPTSGARRWRSRRRARERTRPAAAARRAVVRLARHARGGPAPDPFRRRAARVHEHARRSAFGRRREPWRRLARRRSIGRRRRWPRPAVAGPGHAPALWVDARWAASAVAELIHNALCDGPGAVDHRSGRRPRPGPHQRQRRRSWPAPRSTRFAPLERGPRARALPGAGLGLAIVQAIARAPGATLCNDQDRNACTFTWLPARPAARHAEERGRAQALVR